MPHGSCRQNQERATRQWEQHSACETIPVVSCSQLGRRNGFQKGRFPLVLLADTLAKDLEKQDLCPQGVINAFARPSTALLPPCFFKLQVLGAADPYHFVTHGPRVRPLLLHRHPRAE